MLGQNFRRSNIFRRSHFLCEVIISDGVIFLGGVIFQAESSFRRSHIFRWSNIFRQCHFLGGDMISGGVIFLGGIIFQAESYFLAVILQAESCF